MEAPRRTPQPQPTFRVRLMLSAAVLSIGVLAAASLVVFVGVRHVLWSNLDSALLGIARSEITSALDGPRGRPHVHAVAPADLALPTGSGYEKFAEIEDEGANVVAWTPNLADGPPLRIDAALVARAREGSVAFGDVRRGQGALRAVYYPFTDHAGRRLVSVVAVPREPIDRSLGALLAVLLCSMALGGAVAAWASSRLARSLTLPLERIATAARVVSHTTLGERIPEVSPDAEMRSVTDVLNDMLARLQAAFHTQERLLASQRRFVSDASHELRSPLANLRGTVEVALRRERSPQDYRQTLETSLLEVDRLSRLVNDLLLLSRADTGQLPCHRSAVDLREIACASAAAHEARAQAAGLQLVVTGSAPAAAWADADRLRQVVDNLVDNALRYSPQRSTVEIVVERGERTACLSVRDHGPGIADEDRARVFDRFYRADPSRARASGGLGLGLAIARAIVEAHDGAISVEDGEDEGAVFRVELPACAGTAS